MLLQALDLMSLSYRMARPRGTGSRAFVCSRNERSMRSAKKTKCFDAISRCPVFGRVKEPRSNKGLSMGARGVFAATVFFCIVSTADVAQAQGPIFPGVLADFAVGSEDLRED